MQAELVKVQQTCKVNFSREKNTYSKMFVKDTSVEEYVSQNVRPEVQKEIQLEEKLAKPIET